MTGGVWKATHCSEWGEQEMKSQQLQLSRWIKRGMAGLMTLGALFIALPGGAATVNKTSDSSATITIPLTITNPQPTCNLTFNNGSSTLTYQLGTLGRGDEIRHPPFTVNVNCADSTVVKTALTARNTTGTLQSGNDSVMMRVNGQTSTNGPLFWLESGGQRVKLTGQDTFCNRNDTSVSTPNVCQLRPVTNVPAQSPEGNIDVTVVFDVEYPQ